MTTDERNKIEELVARYELEPDLCDVYVEGSSDAALIKQFLKDNNCRDSFVYEISTVEIPAQVTDKLCLENNDRGRLFALGMILEASLGADNAQVTCVIDSDFDLILHTETECTMLLFTDYTCLEMYLFSESTLEKFFDVFLRGFPRSPATVLKSFAEILQQVFLIRLANRTLKWNLIWLGFERCCVVEEDTIKFDREEYMTRYLNRSGMMSKKKEFTQEVEMLKGKLLQEPRCQIHGHDFIQLLSWLIKHLKNIPELCRPVVVSRCLFLCVSHQDLAKEKMFQHLLQRVQN